MKSDMDLWSVSPLVRKRYRGINRIHLLKQHKLEEFLEEMKKFPTIYRVVIFGSSTSERCTEFSDIDVMLYGGYKSWFIPPRNDEHDILYAETVPTGAEIWKEIAEYGVMIYEA